MLSSGLLVPTVCVHGFSWPIGFPLQTPSLEEQENEVPLNILHCDSDRIGKDLKHSVCAQGEEEWRKAHLQQDNADGVELYQDRIERSGQLRPKYGNNIPSLGEFGFCRDRELMQDSDTSLI